MNKFAAERHDPRLSIEFLSEANFKELKCQADHVLATGVEGPFEGLLGVETLETRGQDVIAASVEDFEGQANVWSRILELEEVVLQVLFDSLHVGGRGMSRRNQVELVVRGDFFCQISSGEKRVQIFLFALKELKESANGTVLFVDRVVEGLLEPASVASG